MTDATELDEAAIRARVEAATEGPWFGAAGGLHIYGATPGDEVAKCRRRADAEFVRHARTDLPAALDEITRLRAALDEARAEHTQSCATTDQWRDQRDRAEAAESALAAVRALADLPYGSERWGLLHDGSRYVAVADLLAALATPTTTERNE